MARYEYLSYERKVNIIIKCLLLSCIILYYCRYGDREYGAWYSLGGEGDTTHIVQGSSGGGIRRITGWHNKNTGQVTKLLVSTWDDEIFYFGDYDSSGVGTGYVGYNKVPASCLGYLGGVMEGEVTRVVMYWVPR